MGLSAAKAALAATTPEPTQPEPKHLADLTRYINKSNLSVAHVADVLSEKATSSSWVVVFKALLTVHHLMVHGNERFLRHLASRDSLFTLHNFLDQSVVEGCAMSMLIRSYGRYLNERSLAYREMASDVTKLKCGLDGAMRTMSTRALLCALRVFQTQLGALLDFNVGPEDLSNSIVLAAFSLLLVDAQRLFASYNDGILNLLDKYFDMRRNQCRESLDLYVKFLGRSAKLAQFLKVAEQAGIEHGDIPQLTQVSHNLLEALQQHLASLEEKDTYLPACGSDVKWSDPSARSACAYTVPIWTSISVPPVPYMLPMTTVSPSLMVHQPLTYTAPDLTTGSCFQHRTEDPAHAEEQRDDDSLRDDDLSSIGTFIWTE